jgi:hypothetical protein
VALTYELVILVHVHRIVMLMCVNLVCSYLYSMFVLYEILRSLINSIYIESNIARRSHRLCESFRVMGKLTQPLNLVIILPIFLLQLSNNSSVYRWYCVGSMGRVDPHVSLDSFIIFNSVGLLCAWVLMPILRLCHIFLVDTSPFPHLRHLPRRYSFHKSKFV